MASIHLRPGLLSDAGALTRLFLAARRTSLPYLPELHTDAETRGWMESVVLTSTTVWVALLDERIAGFASISGACLEHLYVDPAFQRRGVGDALLTKAKELSSDLLWLWTFQRNTAARTFYETRGFVAVELTDGAGNAEGEPDVRYEYRSQDAAPFQAGGSLPNPPE